MKCANYVKILLWLLGSNLETVAWEQPWEPQDVWHHTPETASPWLIGHLAPPLWPPEPQRPQRLEQGYGMSHMKNETQFF